MVWFPYPILPALEGEDVMAGVSINYYAHLGGFLGGLLVMQLMLEVRRHRRHGESEMYGIAAACLLALLAAAFHFGSTLLKSSPWALLSGVVSRMAKGI